MISLIRDRRVILETSILNEFLTLEEANSFSKAARQLQISQATLSRHIKQLEDSYGVPLFERTTQKMKLTPYGESLVAYARDILDDERSFKRDIERIHFKKANHLVIGTVDFPFYYGITTHLAEFKKSHPNATLEVHIASTDDLIRMLSTGKIDVAFMRNIMRSAEAFDSFFYENDYLRIVVPADHPLAAAKSAALQQFSDDTFYHRYHRDSLMYKLTLSLFEEAHITPKLSISEGSWEDSVINDLGTVTTCFGGLAHTFEGNVHVKVLHLEPEVHADIWLAASKEYSHTDITMEFMDFVRAAISSTSR